MHPTRSFTLYCIVLAGTGALPSPSHSAEPNVLPHYAERLDLSYMLRGDGSRMAIHTVDDWQQRRQQIVLGMEAAMGPLPRPESPVPLALEVLEEQQDEGFTRRKVSYHTDRADRRVNAWLLQPVSGEGRRAAVLCLHQTTPRGKDSPAGLSDRPSMHYAKELAQRGFIALVPDYPSLGEYACDFAADDYASGSMKAIYDNVRALDLLASLSDVDPDRIGCIGHSLGGHNSLFTAVFDERIKAVVTCCGFTRFHKYMQGDLRGWAGPRYMPRIESEYQLSPDLMPFDFTEILAALAPRPVYIVAPIGDDNFAVEGVRDVVASARPIYELHGRPAALRVSYPDCGHDFPEQERNEAYAFLAESLEQPKGN